jgi:hypothetical protein
MFEFKHPKYYQELRRKRLELEREAASDKRKEGEKDEKEATSCKRQATEPASD